MDLAQISINTFGAYGISMAMAITAIVALYRIYQQERDRNKEMSDKVLEAFKENAIVNTKQIEAVDSLTNVVERMDNFIRDK